MYTTPVRCTKADFDQILRDLPDFWDGEYTRALHHPSLLYEFGNSAFVLKEEDTVVAYLFGFLAQQGPVSYVHLVAVRKGYRRLGLGRLLYDRFLAFAREHDCTSIKAITSPNNRASIAFHTRLGMELIGTPNSDGIPVLKDYSGPGQDRVVFRTACEASDPPRDFSAEPWDSDKKA